MSTNIEMPRVYPNGLVASDSYYTQLISNDVVAKFSNALYPRRLTYGGFKSLNSNEWLLDEVINLSLHCLLQTSDSNKYLLLTSDITYAIFYRLNDLRDQFFRDLPQITDSSILVMPLLESDNHWCLAIADMKKNEFIFIDPVKSTREKTERKKIEFLEFLRLLYSKGISVPVNGWKSVVLNHINQYDTYNCGVFVVYFMQQLLNREDLTISQCMDSYRHTIRNMLLEMSDDMKQVCICGDYVATNGGWPFIKPWEQCNMCRRYFHKKCAGMRKSPTCRLCDVFVNRKF